MSSRAVREYLHRRLGLYSRPVWMDHEDGRSVRLGPLAHDGPDNGMSGVDKLRGYYDGARNRLKSYLGREDAMGSGSSSPRFLDDYGNTGDVGGLMFQQRPAHCRLEGKQVLTGEEFTDISYSDLGFIITPQSKKLPLNNNYESPGMETPSGPTTTRNSPTPSATTTNSTDVDLDIDVVSTELGSGKNGNSFSTNSSSSNLPSLSMQHRGSTSSFILPGSTDDDDLEEVAHKNVGDLRIEEVTS